MPPGAYAIVGLFSLVSVVAGVLASRIVGPPRWWSAVLPGLAAFGSLYLVGHRIAISVGPEVSLFGFRISLAFDVVVALATALTAALVQGRLVRLLQPQERGTRRDGLA